MGFFDFLGLENNNTNVLKQLTGKSVEKNLKNRRGEPGVDHDPGVGENHLPGSFWAGEGVSHRRVDFVRKNSF